MVFVCSICTNGLSLRPDGLQPNVDVELTGTRCGHLYHSVCLGNWFDTRDVPVRQCPKCREPLSDADTTKLRPCGDEQNEADSERFRMEASRATDELRANRAELNETHVLLTETMENLSVESTTNDFLGREIEKLETENRRLKREAQDQLELSRANEDSLKIELLKLQREKKAVEDDLGYLESSLTRQQAEFEVQLESKNRRILDIESNANELRKNNDYWQRQSNKLRRRDGHVIDHDDLVTNCSTQTENPEMENLEERVRILKLCAQHIDSERNILENLSLRAAASAPCPVEIPTRTQKPSANTGRTGYECVDEGIEGIQRRKTTRNVMEKGHKIRAGPSSQVYIPDTYFFNDLVIPGSTLPERSPGNGTTRLGNLNPNQNDVVSIKGKVGAGLQKQMSANDGGSNARLEFYSKISKCSEEETPFDLPAGVGKAEEFEPSLGGEFPFLSPELNDLGPYPK